MTEPCYTLIQQDDDKEQLSIQDLKKALEHGKDEQKIQTMKKIITLMVNGDPCPQLLMHVIRFVTPSRDKRLKKLLLNYWEVCPKTNPDGKLKQEMILVCNYYKNDLQHPNEFIRGSTLRFLCKLREPELLEPLIPSVRDCLNHKYAYVRKNAIFAIYSIYKNFPNLIPDATELISNVLIVETDMSCKRNALVTLANISLPLAAEYLNSVWSQIDSFDEALQLAVIEIIMKDCRNPTANKSKYIQCIFSLLQSNYASVKYDAATTLVTLSSHETAVKAAASCYISLIMKVPDNNVKLIVLNKLNDLREKHGRIIDGMTMDILCVLSSPDIEVRRKCIDIALEMVSSRNVDEVVSFLKKELVKTHDQEYERNTEYRQLLIHAIHTCAIKFHEVAANVVYVLMEFLGDAHNASAVDVIAFVKEVLEKIPELRSKIVQKLMESFREMNTGRFFRGALWIIGEYCLTAEDIEAAMNEIRNALGELPLLASEQKSYENELDDSEKKEGEEKRSTQPRVLADGTYATESAFSSSTTAKKENKQKPPIRALLLKSDFYLGSVLASTLTKLVLRYEDLCKDVEKVNSLKSEAMLIMTGIINLGRSKFVNSTIDEDSVDRIMTCLRTLSSVPEDQPLKDAFLNDSRNAYSQLVRNQDKKAAEEKELNKKNHAVQVDDVINFSLLKSKKNVQSDNDEVEADLTRATGSSSKTTKVTSQLSRVMQLTGFSDPVYAEAYVNVHQYNILLDILIVNQTSETLQNLTLEFSTLGDLKLLETPVPHTLRPHGFHTVKANIKVSSTETGVIFGNIVYDGPGALDTSCVILNDIHIDIMDYIKPAYCSETKFRSMWTEFEWENKVNVNTNITDLRQYINHIMKTTNMACLTPEHALSGECGFLGANMYARSIFGEDALANICLEKQGDSIAGHIRIRSKTQGIALSLGDKITLNQKILKN
jgi:coatomer subunit beta